MSVNQNIKAKLTQTRAIGAKLNTNQNFLVTNYQLNASSIRLGDLIDIDVSGVSDGAVILYDETSSRWVATTRIDNINTIINGGNF
jgi:hypothetical protein